MAYKCVILDSAEVEREEIVKYLVEDVGSTQAAVSFLASMDREVDVASDIPTVHSLSRIPEVAEKGYRSALFGSYAMLYRFEGDTVYIAHVFHQRQNYATLL